eukprot:403368320
MAQNQNLKVILDLNKNRVNKILKTLKNPMSNYERQKFYSYYNYSRFRKTKPTLNRLQNVMQHQKQLYTIRQQSLQSHIKLPNFNYSYQKLAFKMKQGFQRKVFNFKHELILLSNSRILQFLTMIPLCYLAYNIGRQAYISYLSYQYPGYYIKPATPIKDKVKQYVSGAVGEILNDASVQKEGLNFLSKLFEDAQTHEAGVLLLKNVLNDPRFVDESKVFGIDLISGVIQSDRCQEDFKTLVMKTLEHDDVRKETVELLRYIVTKVESEDILAHYFKTVFMRDDMGNSVQNLLVKAAVESLEQPVIKDKFGRFVVQIANNSDVKSQLYNSYLIKPAKRFFSLGLISGEENGNGNGVNGNNNNNGN